MPNGRHYRSPQYRLARRSRCLEPFRRWINADRGSVVDLPVLRDAVVSRKIAGAGLDALPQEPPAPEEAVLGLDNVVLIAHLADCRR
jgi:phosphoglycerate dehydrogenase-like enzyme